MRGVQGCDYIARVYRACLQSVTLKHGPSQFPRWSRVPATDCAWDGLAGSGISNMREKSSNDTPLGAALLSPASESGGKSRHKRKATWLARAKVKETP